MDAEDAAAALSLVGVSCSSQIGDGMQQMSNQYDEQTLLTNASDASTPDFNPDVRLGLSRPALGTLQLQPEPHDIAKPGHDIQVLASTTIRIDASRLTTSDSRTNGRSSKVNSARRQVNSARQTGELCKRRSPDRVMTNQGVVEVIPRTLQAQHYPKMIRKLYL